MFVWMAVRCYLLGDGRVGTTRWNASN